MRAVKVESSRLASASLHLPLSGARRIDRLIPIILYSICIAVTWPQVGPAWHPQSCNYDPAEQAEAQLAVEAELEAAENEFRSPYFPAGPRTPEEQCSEDRMDILTVPLVCWITAITIHALLFLACVWSTWFAAKIRYEDAPGEVTESLVKRGLEVRVVPVEHAGPAVFCKAFIDDSLVRAPAPPGFKGAAECGRRIVFRHQKRLYAWNGEAFTAPTFPIALSFGEYLGARGLDDAGMSQVGGAPGAPPPAPVSTPSAPSALVHSRAVYGENRITIEVPTFKELFLYEHAVAPFFAFQMFCVLLWCLDDYPLYAAFTGVMVAVFEATVVFQRIKNLGFIKSMVPPGHDVYVYRSAKWRRIHSSDLVPGDLFSLARAKAGETVPCDAVILYGGAVVNESTLTGESTPQIKEACDDRRGDEVLDVLGSDRRHVAFGGTSVMQSTQPQAGSGCPVPSPPDGGCVCFVMRTGFETSQGGLMKTIIFSAERSSANNIEALAFIMFLLVFAIAASRHVLLHGLEDRDRSRYRLMLSCTYIITSVIPPELPMELALAVNTSLVALSRLAIFCTEPYRIPFAGKVDTVFFDKTGTLVSEDLEVMGVAGVDLIDQGGDGAGAGASGKKVDTASAPGLSQASELPAPTRFVLMGCHHLTHVDDEVVGDAMEKGSVEWLGCRYTRDGVCGPAPQIRAVEESTGKGKGKGKDKGKGKGKKKEYPPSPFPDKIRIVKRFPFTSALKRSSAVIAHVRPGGAGAAGPCEHSAVIKGAPEVIASLLDTVPDGFHETLKHFALEGCRLLALAHRPMGTLTNSQAHAAERDEIEGTGKCKGKSPYGPARFAGFLVLSSPHKEKSAETIKALTEGGCEVAMVTGDGGITACAVSAALGMTPADRTHLILEPKDGAGDTAVLSEDVTKGSGNGDGSETGSAVPLVWRSLDDTVVIPFDPSAAAELSRKYVLCLTGPAVRSFQQLSVLESLVPHVRIYSRFSPTQKETLVSIARKLGRHTAMCGDGTNDVGALKMAHVGMALLNAGAPAGMVTMDKESREKDSRLRKRKMLQRVITDPADANGRAVSMLEQRARAMLEEMGEEEDDSTPKPVSLGDASIAAPFVSKSPCPWAVVKLIIEGRRSLVATLQIYRILAVNCLISSYSLSVLNLAGVKLGDTQMTLQGVTIAGVFFAISRSQPSERLSPQRPKTSIFRPGFFVSVLGQFAVHLWCMMSVVALAEESMKHTKRPKPDDSFKPSLVNTVVYLMSNAMMLSSILVNVAGPPHMASLTKNKGLVYAVAINVGVTVAVVCEMFPAFNKYMELVPFPEDGNFRAEIINKLTLSFAGSWLWDRVTTRLLW